MKFSIVFLNVTLACGSAHAINVRDALISAYQNNQGLLETRQKVIASHEKIVQAKGGFRPKVEARANGSIAKSDTKVGGTTTQTRQDYKGLLKKRSAAVTVSQNLFKGFSDVATVSKTEHEIASAWAQLKGAEQDTFINVIKAYLEMYAKYATVEVYKANLAFVQKQYESIRTKREIGEETKTQESTAEAKYMEAQAKLQSGLAELEAAKAGFEQLTGLAAPERVDHPKELVEVPVSVETLQDIALRENPKITQAIEDIASAKQNKRAITGALLPSLELQATSSKAITKNKTNQGNPDIYQNPSDNQLNNEVGLTLTIPLYDAGVTRSQRRGATETVIEKRINFEKVRQEIIQGCKQAYRTYLAAKINMENSVRQVKAQEVAVEGTIQEMQVGTKILLDVLNAQTYLMQAKLDQINTTQQFYLYLYQMLSLQGKLTAEGLQLPVEVFHPQQNYEDIKNHI